jgi:hypothetical protein
MHEFRCLINKVYKKISYPTPVALEPLYLDHLQPLPIVIDEISSGEMMVIEFFNKKILKVFLVEDSKLNQIFGEPILNQEGVELFCQDWVKRNEIKKYIKWAYDQLRLNEMIANKNDLIDLENELMKYLLSCRSKEKNDLRKIRSLIFKSCKNHKFAEKIYSIIKNKLFDYYTSTLDRVNVDFDALAVQIEYGA